MAEQNLENVNSNINENETETSQVEETTIIEETVINKETLENEPSNEIGEILKNEKEEFVQETSNENIEETVLEIKEQEEITELETNVPELIKEETLENEPSSEIDEFLEKDKENFLKEISNDNIEETISEQQENTEEIIVPELNNEEILQRLSFFIKEVNVEKSKKNIDFLLRQYEKNHKEEIEKERIEFLKQNVEGAEFIQPKDRNEEYLKELIAEYKKNKIEYQKNQEKIKQENLQKKLDIIEKIRILTEGKETLNKSFAELKDLQKQWIEVGPVPTTEAKELLSKYQIQVGKFYDLVKIEYELRDLDQKKNLDQKIELCEKSEELLLEPDVVLANKKFQDLYNQWRLIGAVPRDKSEEIWDRFKETGNKIRKNYNQHFETLREERDNNYKQKIAICEKIELIVEEANPNTGKEWGEISDKIMELQKAWKTIGMVPKDLNEEIYLRFKSVCNRFFENKNEFWNNINEEFNSNLQKKIELCVSAEAIQNSTEWKKTSEMFIDLTKKWKEIGPVAKKHSDTVWKRFRAACDTFFNAKSNYYANIETEQNNNKIKKEELIAEINNFQPSENQTENIERLKSFQTRWTEIGYVANTDKDRLYAEFRKAIDNTYKNFNITNKSIELNNFKEKIDSHKDSNDSKFFDKERNKILQQIRTLEIDITKIESTMSYFTNGSTEILKDFKTKINVIKDQISVLKEKKKAIDLAERDSKKNIQE